ncbi:unnamed protein product, partial [Vitis vinifera]
MTQVRVPFLPKKDLLSQYISPLKMIFGKGLGRLLYHEHKDEWRINFLVILLQLHTHIYRYNGLNPFKGITYLLEIIQRIKYSEIF